MTRTRAARGERLRRAARSAKKAEKILGWTPKTTFKELVNEMIEFSLNKN